MIIITFNVTKIKMSQQEEGEERSHGGSEAEIEEEEKGEAAYVPKNPLIRPGDV